VVPLSTSSPQVPQVPATQVVPGDELITATLHQLDDTFRCRGCRHGITHGRFAIEVDGAHAHTFRNPVGWSFRLGCFADAPGAAVSGTATYVHTWFSGYAWRFAHCGACGTHLGWWFVAGSDVFAGLVLTRLM
jgi:hypothetical protein